MQFADRPVFLLVVGSLLAGLGAEVLIRVQGLPGAAHLIGLGLLYMAWWMALSGAVARVTGSPIHWFTNAVPLAAGVLVFIGEPAIARDGASIGEMLSSLWAPLVIAVPIVTILAVAQRGCHGRAGWSLGHSCCITLRCPLLRYLGPR
jgi:hypothetical protein